MAWETKEGTGSLFKNSRKENDNHPNAKGEAKIGGVIYEVAAWTKKDKNGNPWQSLSFKVKAEDASRREPARKPPADVDDLSDVPF